MHSVWHIVGNWWKLLKEWIVFVLNIRKKNSRGFHSALLTMTLFMCQAVNKGIVPLLGVFNHKIRNRWRNRDEPRCTEVVSAQNPVYHLAPTALALADGAHGVLSPPPPHPRELVLAQSSCRAAPEGSGLCLCSKHSRPKSWRSLARRL